MSERKLFGTDGIRGRANVDPMTPEMALRLGKLCGNGPELWLSLQSHYDLDRLSKAKRAEIAAIPTLAAE